MQLEAVAAAFVAGLAGSVHCVGMCGGIVGMLSAAGAPSRKTIVIHTAPRPLQGLGRVLAYNGGRLASYAVAGALAGGIAGAGASFARIGALQNAAFWMVQLTMLLLGLYLLGAAPVVAHLETAGRKLWRHVQPLAAPLLPMDTQAKAFTLGTLWGWLPCGMVYGMLLLALFSGSMLAGAAIMLAFGLGTLPAMLASGLAGDALRRAAQGRTVRLLCGGAMLAFAAYGMLRALRGVMPPWLMSLCVPL
ncbi:MAG TPA: sulfite exporter TauE/SafE family protein [Burkholderiaceae bacterium]